MDMCNLITWHEHEKWISTLFEAFNQDSPQGFSPPSLAQLLKADREIFLRMSKDVGSLKLDKDGNKPLDLALARLRCDPRVTMHLLCVAGAKQSAAIADAPTVTGEDPKKKKKERQRKTKKNEKADKEKETKKPTQTSTVDYHTKTKEGERICVAFNIRSCAEKGDKCPKGGAHVCSYCLKPGHPYKECRTRVSKSK